MAESLREWLTEHPPSDDRFTATLVGVANRIAEGEPLYHPVKEFLDEVALMNPGQIQRAIDDRPAETGERRFDSYLGALAEHLAAIHGFRRPEWSYEPQRLLDTFWFVSEIKAFRALALVGSPAAFRRRGIFISAGSLTRV